MPGKPRPLSTFTTGKLHGATGRANVVVHLCLHIRILPTAPADQQSRGQKRVFNNIVKHADMKLKMSRTTDSSSTTM